MKAPLLFTGLCCVCFAACSQRHSPANNGFQKSADTAATAYKTASDVDAAYENNKISEWRAAQDGDEAIMIGRLLVKTNLICGEYLIRESNKQRDSYLCACRPGVEDHEKWVYVQLWPLSNEWRIVKASEVKNPPDL
ncbi:hypothetical protein AAFN85_16285 [Mucilaginibacter sp. CAU 1740]|uniref:hypothetical protein n=1 Tax=Mucilaginibacter sp. CAU 1740 TaxID=3140365 RepID=UPI00325B43A4